LLLSSFLGQDYQLIINSMAWNEMTLDQQIEKCWEQIGRGYAESDILKINKYAGMLVRCLRRKSEKERSEIDVIE